jgi:esterase/lipase superfamily enzyme
MNRLEKERNGEPLVVLSHSMGGQLIWDAVTWLLPRAEDMRDLQIDFWCAAARQVGFFEEAKLFAASNVSFAPSKPVPFPSDHLGI